MATSITITINGESILGYTSSSTYSVTSTGLVIDGTTVYTFSGTGYFGGFTTSSSSSYSDSNLEVGDSGTLSDLTSGSTLTLYSISEKVVSLSNLKKFKNQMDNTYALKSELPSNYVKSVTIGSNEYYTISSGGSAQVIMQENQDIVLDGFEYTSSLDSTQAGGGPAVQIIRTYSTRATIYAGILSSGGMYEDDSDFKVSVFYHLITYNY